MNSDSFSTGHLTAVLENAPIAVYICAVDDYELLYANALAKKMFLNHTNFVIGACYKAMGFTEKCPFCQIKKMNQSEFLVREFVHPENGRIYQLNGKIIDWDGRQAHVEYITDITERRQEENQAKVLEERLEQVFDSIPCGLCVYTFDGKTISPVFHNQVFYEIMGYSEEHRKELEQKTSFLGVHPQDLLPLSESIQSAIRRNGVVQHTYRVLNDRLGEYRWIHLEGAVKGQPDHSKLLYAVYSDVSEQRQLEIELAEANEQMQDIVNSIPGGVAVYKVSDILRTVYFSDGVPELAGYTSEEYNGLTERDALNGIYKDDAGMVVLNVKKAIETHGTVELEFRIYHKSGYIVWVRGRVKWIGEEDGCQLLHCVLHNISALKEAQLELAHLVNSIPGGIASYQVEESRFVPTYISDGVASLTGHSREEYEQLVRYDAVDTVYEMDRDRVLTAARAALASGDVLDVFFRMRHKDGNLTWLHLNGRRIGPLSEVTKFYAVFTGMSQEARLYQNIVNETADGIYVINKENYDLLYAYDSGSLFAYDSKRLGKKCYSVLYGKDSPCEFCTLTNYAPDGKEHEMADEKKGRYYSSRVWETEWNRIPSYIQYIQDVTEAVMLRKEKNRLEQYFQTLVEKLPGGVAVVRCEEDGSMTPEFLSDGFAAMTGMSLENAWKLYRQDAMAGVHPHDWDRVNAQIEKSFAEGERRCEITYRLLKEGGSYVWVKNACSIIVGEDGAPRIYSVYHDISAEREEQEQLRQQYKELLLQHYRTTDPNALIVGHCNVTKDRILEIIDHTDSDLLESFSFIRDAFFRGLSGLIVDGREQEIFRSLFMNAPTLEAFAQKRTEVTQTCFIKLPKEENGRYVCFKVNLVKAPDSGDITGILTVTDVTGQTIADRILHQLSVSSHDFVIDLDLLKDTFTVLAKGENAEDMPMRGSHSQRLVGIRQSGIVPKDEERYVKLLQPDEIYRRLNSEGTYTFAFSLSDETGSIRTKNLRVSAADLRLGRVCLVRNDITDYVREQQGMLNMIAYTFELAGVIDAQSGRLTMHTRQTVLQNLSPFVIDDYKAVVTQVASVCREDSDWESILEQFRLETMLRHLEEKPSGYDFVYPYKKDGDSIRYKQINVLWGEENHRTICIVRADVTDMISAERKSKKTLEDALNLAEKANQAKSEFLSTMSHDIRTPMNAIIGMTTLAEAHLDDQDRVADCLRKISISSNHLLSLINDILDMSKIEHSKITLGRMRLSFSELIEQLSAMMAPQARASGLRFVITTRNIKHNYFYGDGLRTNQILINILSNAVKFTPDGGSVDFLAEELMPVKSGQNVRYRFTISDTGKGMTEDFFETIFEPFARGSSVSRIEGTGLGLSITKGLVDLMGGSIAVKSRVNEGSVFRVELEYEIAPEEGSAGKGMPVHIEGSEHKKCFEGYCFLIAEDNAINAEILSELLKMDGAESVVRTDGEQAVEEFRQSKAGTYDAILMDIQMPKMSGYEATRAIRELERADAQCIPIIAMTANAFAEDVQASLDAGMTAHVSKPINLKLLRETLISVVR